MTRFTFLGVAAFLSTAIATPVMAQAVIQEPGAYAFHYPNGDLGIGSTPSRPREAVVGGGAGGASASIRPVHSSSAGRETATRPWSAPVGHRQPRAADVPTSISASHRPLIQKTRMSTARSEMFAEAAERPNFQLYDHRRCLLMHSVGPEGSTSGLHYPGSFRWANHP